MQVRKFVLALFVATAAIRPQSVAADDKAAEKPNIVFILFDDMGYGEPPCYRAKSEFKMPTLDRLAKEGMRFTDAHTPSAVCTPTRYGLLTGRLFESVLYRYCRARRLTLTETAGSRTIRRVPSASGFRHESDGVIATPDLTVHLELKHLSGELGKNDLLIFNQKGMDFLAADNASFRSKPLYRVIVSGSKLTPEARRFAVQWGILAIEPDRLPLLALHWLAGRNVPHLDEVDEPTQEEIWREIPHLVTPLQKRINRLSGALGGGMEIVGSHRIEKAMTYQREAGDYYWMALEEEDPTWLTDKYDGLHRELDLDSAGAVGDPGASNYTKAFISKA
ncbi:MAG: hypothetical protein EXS09_20725 [Gemmataceae bacterium]|nr:hypothetical protein [Gemmataceae bacterium]